MNTTQQRMTAIFNEWAKRYAENGRAVAVPVQRCFMRSEYPSLIPTKLSDYGSLVDDYDVSEVEDAHIQAATRYGW